MIKDVNCVDFFGSNSIIALAYERHCLRIRLKVLNKKIRKFNKTTLDYLNNEKS